MKRLTYTRPHNLVALSDELIAAIPALAPVVGTDGFKTARMTLSGDGTNLAIEVPDNADVVAIDNVVAAHTNPAPPVIVPVDFGADALDDHEKLRQAVQNIRTYQGLGAAAVTQAQRKQYEDMIGNAVIALARRVIGG